jgi:transcriptional regulator with XRE-family HTH domain
MARRKSTAADLPTEFSLRMGELLREARTEKGYSQDDLAALVPMRRPPLTLMEQGKMLPDIVTLVVLSSYLDTPLTALIPEPYRDPLPDGATVEELQLIRQFRRIQSEDHKRLALAQVKAIADMEQG